MWIGLHRARGFGDPAVDTVASIKTPKQRRLLKLDERGFITSIETTALPFALIDDWAMLPDGTIATVRGQDYHVDWLGDGRLSSSPKVAFDWQRLDDARKQTLIDSVVAAFQAQLDRATGGANGGGIGGGRGTGGGRGGSGPPGNPGPPVEMVPNLVKRATLGDVPDYWPAFDRGGVHPDAQGNLWIQTTAMVAGRPVLRRRQSPGRVGGSSATAVVSRAIAGLGGASGMAVQDSAGAVHLERARLK
jgi:hypothetical protein